MNRPPTKVAEYPTEAGAHQVGGDHYVKYELQPWDAMRQWFTAEEFRGFLRGCALKYLVRYRDKGGVESLDKASHYIDKLIEHERREEAKNG